jgi:hypothetical protein
VAGAAVDARYLGGHFFDLAGVAGFLNVAAAFFAGFGCSAGAAFVPSRYL